MAQRFDITVKIKYTEILTASHKSLKHSEREAPKHIIGDYREVLQDIHFIFGVCYYVPDCLLIRHHEHQFTKKTDDPQGILSL
jgi:hypothetical protein